MNIWVLGFLGYHSEVKVKFNASDAGPVSRSTLESESWLFSFCHKGLQSRPKIVFQILSFR
jgi:hypothetical protein